MRRASIHPGCRTLTLAIILALSLAAPATSEDPKADINDIGNRRVAHRSMISEQKEIAYGRQLADDVEHSARLINDPVVTEYVNRVAQNIARNSDLKIPLTVKVIDSPDINAFALPGGFLYVNSGVLKAAEEEDQLAGVIAHEIAHVAARHWASQATRATLLQYATIPLIFVPMSYPVYIGVSNALNFGIPMAFLKFNRSAESEADYLGLQYLYKAGYDPNAYVTFFGKVTEAERREPGSVPSVFLDHPPTADRIIKAEREIKKLLPSRDQYLVSTSEFVDVRARLESELGQRRIPDGSGTPTLTRRDHPAADPQDTASDAPPVLRRRDSAPN
jgi:predicted Zn-dependent protease